MRISILITALMSSIAVSALPTTSSSTSSICSCDTSPSVGATIFKESNPTACGNVASDYTTIPTGQGCIDLSNFFGSWEDHVGALVVAKGQKCEFYTEFACPSTNAPLCLGSKTEPIIKATVPKTYQGKIKSAQCHKL
ncbi:hypothetical protein K458DRAFT_389298 [Lentithecium fluviatile CBS 122367]|uniref:Uncharacterized protein n=1 Tax=Lentithecium fluviatile CBS 122367 TaxID=1168545 RepID=A0A6G1J0P8_9PLEO|nr:hypothetical protein K458DRAFT_389298 [Lentithecium fluviatile CBS 122367]